MTERNNLQNQLLRTQRLESIGEIAGGMAHDFNNILGIIIGYAGILRSANGNKKKLETSINAIDNASRRGAEVVKQLLTFARKNDVIFRLMNVNDVVAELVRLLEETLPRTISIVTDLDANLPPVVGDAGQIHQLLLNLCVNARDAMPEGGTLTVTSSLVEPDVIKSKWGEAEAAEYVLLKVIDTGTGMNEEVRLHIFEPFFTTKGEGRGTGLGLSAAFGIMERHHGFIDVQSELGNGTAFLLYFPVRQLAAGSFRVENEVTSEIVGGDETIFVIEDEELLRELVSTALVGKGYMVIDASDGIEAVETYKKHSDKISLVLCDLDLPKLEGSEVLKRLKEINPSVKFIVASGYIDSELREEILSLGAKGIVMKPYVQSNILKTIREVLDED